MRGHDLLLRTETLDAKQCEALEEILKRIQFRLIDLEDCNLDDEVGCDYFETKEFILLTSDLRAL